MTRSRNTILTAALSTLLIGCGSSGASNDGSAGGTGGTGGGGGGAAVNCGDGPIDPTALIDDMETPDFLTPFGRGSSWWAGGDPAPGASITPNGSVNAEEIPGGRCDSKYAVRVTGGGFAQWTTLNVSMGWGSVDGGAESGLSYDASFRAGITFWARIGDTSTDKISVKVTDKYSSVYGGICDPMPGASMATACYDHFGTELPYLSTTWKEYKIPFLGLKQLGFGLPRPQFDSTTMYAIEFQFPVGSVFDFWVDDVRFY